MKKNLSLIFSIITMAWALPMQAQYFTVGPEVGYERANHKISGSQYKDVTARSGDGIRIGAAAYGLSDNKRFPYHFPTTLNSDTRRWITPMPGFSSS